MKFSDLSIRAKLVTGAGVLFAVSMAGLIAGGIALMYQTAGTEAQERARALVASYSQMASGQLGGIVNMTQGVGAAIEGAIQGPVIDRDQLGRIVTQAIEARPTLMGMTLAFEPNQPDGRDAEFIGHAYSDQAGRFVPYFARPNGELIVEQLDMSPEAGTGEWYDLPIKENRNTLVPPYSYTVGGKTVLMTTVSVVIRKNEKPIGILTSDLTLDTIAGVIGQLKPFGVGTVQIISNNGLWIVNPDPALAGTAVAPDVAAALQDTARMEQGMAYADADGVQQFAVTTQMQFPGVPEQWTMIMQVPLATIYAGVDNTRNLAIGAAAILALVALGLVWFGAGFISGPIQKMTAIMRELAQGKYDLEVPYQQGKDEIGNMARAVEVFRENGLKISQMTEAEAARIVADEQQRRAMMTDLQAAFGEVVDAAIAGDFTKRVHAEFPDAELNSLARSVNSLVETVDSGVSETGIVLGALAQTDLTVRMQGNFSGAFAKLKNDANAVAETLSDVVGQLKHTSRSIKTATGEILSGANDLSERTTKQAATIEETSAAMEQLAHTVLQNADRARDANADAQLVSRTAEEGGEVMSRATKAMEQISTSSGKISNIIGLIDDIAFQTNLLALNASVEAARAGDAGKGFAVVAVEVRRLAQSAAQASSDVKALIEASSGEVGAGTKLVAEAAAKLAAMLEAARSNSALMEGMARDSREQAAAIEEVTVAVRQMDEMTQHNAALVEQTNAAIEQTEAQASELDRIVAVFHTDDRSAAPQPAVSRSHRPAPRPVASQKAAKAYLSQGSAAISADWDEF
ncbi:methyl-accepting chemotaxis protein [Devosia sp.]|uniref:methyl-accepting chemotaxis protein n=1 Tax=Devosia sp. TaxID=1871048 RepID=UPI0025D8BD80|nr:methyl-accepting chemotaxis protein [Devosia sp.]MCR6635222.1 methyl-accepting chemotaxis protein [Devosia sp.]